MKCSLEHLNKAAEQGLITSTQAQALWEFLKHEDIKTHPWAIGAYSLAGALIFCAAGLLTYPFINLVGATNLTLIYTLLSISLTFIFAYKHYFKASMLFAFITPIISYLFLNLYFDSIPLTPPIDNHYHGFLNAFIIVIETLILWGRLRMPLLFLPLFSFIGISGYEGLLLIQAPPHETYFFILYGLITLSIAMLLERKLSPEKDNTFWIYLLGVSALGFGLFIATPKYVELYFIIYTLSNLILLGLGARQNRYIFYIISALGFCVCINHYTNLLLEYVNGYIASLIFLSIGTIILGIAIKLKK